MKTFNGYEVKQVVECVDSIGNKFCEPLENGTIEDARKDANYVADFWTLYGHLEGEGVRCIGDYDQRAAAVEMYCFITGDYALDNLIG